MDKVLLTGATGYIGKRLLPFLVEKGYAVICCVRDKNKFHVAESIKNKIEVIELDLTKKESLSNIPHDIDFAYYLVHSMSASTNYNQLEQQSAINFREAVNKTKAKQVVYLSGIVNSETLSKHLQSRKNVEHELSKGNYALTTVRAGIIIGSGSASFEIIRDLVEKLPVMIAPKWLRTKCQPIGIADVIKILTGVLGNTQTYNHNYDIAGNEILTYKEMLLWFAQVRGLKRKIWTVPVMTPKLSSYWLYFITSTSYKLATSLVDSMKVEVIAKDNEINKLLQLNPLPYKECIERAFYKIQQNEILSSWKDSTVSGRLDYRISEYIKVPEFGCYKDIRKKQVKDELQCVENIWKIGGETGWYYANWLWRLRGFIDKLFGGVGLRRGRTNLNHIQAGDTLDFWRVIYSNKSEMRLLLFAEMKLPGDAWLEFQIKDKVLVQTATFRPKGLLGRLYWYSVLPLHGFIFTGLINKLTKNNHS
ncbi:SDR family oxidoreductase [Plebeiibacterium sediminum]|uniref:SDR family oxidoreductase n=1 Tax=Plebeiibacterium sediminum TaxID=2992112 RepID=A0AAE3M1A8_9BACT|nr:SDR family oxidoreductase [Plebeiobacterium sediminum]MCW3785288.1 SDR family oxidoreductase [Plebeiobacterium sediminum]